MRAVGLLPGRTPGPSPSGSGGALVSVSSSAVLVGGSSAAHCLLRRDVLPPGALRHGSGWTVGGPAGSGPPLSCCEVTPSSAVLPFILTPQVTESGSQLPTGIICSVMSFCLYPQSLSPVKTLMCPTARALWRLRGGCGLSWKPQQQVGLCAPNTARVWSDYPAAKTGSGAHSFTLWSL